MGQMCVIVYFQPSGNSPLWDQQSSADGSSANLWFRPPTTSSPPAGLTRLATGRKGAARRLCLPGTHLPVYLCVCELSRKTMEIDKMCIMWHNFYEPALYVCVSIVFGMWNYADEGQIIVLTVCDYRYCSHAVEDGH